MFPQYRYYTDVFMRNTSQPGSLKFFFFLEFGVLRVLLAQLAHGQRQHVHLVRPVRNAQRARLRVGVRQGEVLTHPGAAVYLSRAV